MSTHQAECHDVPVIDIYIYIYPHVCGHRAAGRVARRGEATVERGVAVSPLATCSQCASAIERSAMLARIGSSSPLKA
eukprot:scaffold124879_cov72-Phaeocystis_antarctica.AAC.1